MRRILERMSSILPLAMALTLSACGQAKAPAPAKSAAPPSTTSAPSTAPDTSLVDQTVKDVAGPWDFSGVKGDPVCRLTLSAKQLTGALALEKAADCDREFPILAPVTSWIVKGDGNISLTDKERRIVLTMSQQEDGLYLSITPAEETYSLVNQDSADFARSQPSAVIEGRWKITALDGDVLCTIDLNAASETPMAGIVVKTSPCLAPDKLNKAVTFEQIRDQLSFRDGAGREVLTFEPGDSATWQSMGEANDKVLMTR
ncbi:MAG: AprI/Inh family metalloprotease inhibitor [Caulobacterales bacterium]